MFLWVLRAGSLRWRCQHHFWFITSTFSLCFTWWTDKGYLWSFSLWALIPFLKASPSWPKHFPKVLHPNTIMFGIRILTYENLGDTDIQIIAINNHVVTKSVLICIKRFIKNSTYFSLLLFIEEIIKDSHQRKLKIFL